jgi:hypothetical protein
METTNAQTTAKKQATKKTAGQAMKENVQPAELSVAVPVSEPEQSAKKGKKSPAKQSVAASDEASSAVVSEQTESENVVVQEFDMNQSIEEFNVLCDKITEFSKVIKEYSLVQKDNRAKVDQLIKKFKKSTMQAESSFFELCFKQISVVEKSGGSKTVVQKKVTDKSKSPVHKKQVVRDPLLKFMDLEPNTLVSRAEALNAINSFVREHKEKKNPDIVVAGDNRSFRLIGKLKTLFEGIAPVMVAKGITTPIPDHIKFTDIMGYMSHCFVGVSAEVTTA